MLRVAGEDHVGIGAAYDGTDKWVLLWLFVGICRYYGSYLVLWVPWFFLILRLMGLWGSLFIYVSLIGLWWVWRGYDTFVENTVVENTFV